MILLSHKIRLRPNNKQATYFKRACGIRRFAYNWALEESRKLHEQGVKTSGFDLSRRFNAIKGQRWPWVRKVTKWAPQRAINDAWGAFRRWWSGKSNRPRFKKRGRCRDSFYLGMNHFTVEDQKLRVSKLGWVRMAQEVRFPGKIKNVTIGRDGDGWFASFMIEVDEYQWTYPHTCETQAVCGVDLGVRDLAVLNDGTKFPCVRALRKSERKLRKLQKSVSRKKKGSSNRRKVVLKLARAHQKVRDIRKAATHEITSWIVRWFRWIGVEDLNVRGMLKNRRLAKSIQDAAFGEIRRQLQYKAELADSNIVVADRWFPSSKRCSVCGHVLKNLPLSKRSWTCPECGAEHDRDVCGAQNLAYVAARYAETQNACGDAVSLVFNFFREVEEKPVSMKQEPSCNPTPKRVA